jgi:hypothetical protein
MLTLLLSTALAGADQDYANQRLVKLVLDTRRDGVSYTSEVVGDQIYTTGQAVELGSRSWTVTLDDEELSAWDFAQVVGDDELMGALRADKRQQWRRSLVFLAAGGGLATGGAVLLQAEATETYGQAVMTGAIVAGVLGLVGTHSARGVDDEPVNRWLDEDQVDAAIGAFNAGLADALGVGPEVRRSHPDVLSRQP